MEQRELIRNATVIAAALMPQQIQSKSPLGPEELAKVAVTTVYAIEAEARKRIMSGGSS